MVDPAPGRIPAIPIDALGRVHLIGIGGAGMSALAKVILARGMSVSGSDLKESRAVLALRALGAHIEIGHRASNAEGAGVVVVSTAIPGHNPESVAAAAAGTLILQRAQLLAMLMRERRGIAIAGTHGKTTTTSMLAVVFQRAGLDPTFLIGGDLNETGTNAHRGTGSWLIAEADESDGSFLWLGPEIAVVTNIEADHLDHYADETSIREAFAAFLGGVDPNGLAVVCADDPGVRAVTARCDRRLLTYGIEAGELRAIITDRDETGTRARIIRGDDELGELRLGVPGPHNVRNALAAIGVALEAGIGFEAITDALASFGGVARRFHLRGAADGVTVIDDYAHHPTEIRATLVAARERGWERIIAVFQPHRYSRTKHLGAALGASLADADLAVVTDVYGADEEPEPGVSGKLVIDGLLAAAPHTRAIYLPKRSSVAEIVAARAEPGDLILTLGAGDVTMLAEELLVNLVAREADNRIDAIHRGAS